MKRRDLLIAGTALAGVYGFGRWLRRPRFEFTKLDHPAGFRSLPTGQISGGVDIFAGLDAPDATVVARAAQLKDPCPVLMTNRIPGRVPVAVFSDIQCPYCRVLEPIILDLQSRGEIAVTWHDPALLGARSETAALALTAAGYQGAQDALRARLNLGRFVATPAYLSTAADALGIDGRRLVADSASAAAQDTLISARALARIFAIPGTPALVVGRTLVVGGVTRRELSSLIELEAWEGNFPCAVSS